MKTKLFVALFIIICTSLNAGAVPKGFKAQELAPLGGELIMPESWHFKGGMTQTGFMFIASKEKNDDGSYETGFRIQGVVGIKQKAGCSAKEAAQKNLKHFEESAKKVIRTWPELEYGSLRRIGIEVLQPNPKNPSDDFHVIYSFFWNDDMDLMAATIFGAPESTWPEAEKVVKEMGNLKLLDVAKIQAASGTASAPPALAAPKEAKGFALGSINIGYMSQAEFTERITTDETVAYIDRVKTKCGAIFAEDKAPKQFNIVLVVHSEHSHVWIVDSNGFSAPGMHEVEQQLQALTLPRLKKEPLIFAIDARIAGGSRVDGKESAAPTVPDVWNKVLQKNKADKPMHFDDVIRLVCDK